MNWKYNVKYNLLAGSILLICQYIITTFLKSNFGINMFFLIQLFFYILILVILNLIAFVLLKNKERFFKNISYRILKDKIISAINDPGLLFDTSPISRIDLVRDNQDLHKYILIISANQRDIHYQNIDKWWGQKNLSDILGRSFNEVYIKEKESEDKWFVHVQPSGKGLPDSVDKKHTWRLYRMGFFSKLKYLYEMSK